MARPRFIVSSCVGHLSAGSGKSLRAPGATFTVLDTAYLHSVVGLFRSEDETGGRAGMLGGITRAEGHVHAEAKAVAPAESLNEWAASA